MIHPAVEAAKNALLESRHHPTTITTSEPELLDFDERDAIITTPAILRWAAQNLRDHGNSLPAMHLEQIADDIEQDTKTHEN